MTIAAPRTVGVGRTWFGLIALSLAFGLVQLDASIVTVALNTIRAAFSGGLSAAQWVLDGYTVPFAAAMLTAGALGDRLGHRKICVGGFALFAAASVLCALASDLNWLIAGRVLQGLGAAVLLPSSLALVSDLFPDSAARARALGIWGGVASVGFAAGPLLGGALISSWHWSAIFWINLPLCLLIGAAIWVSTEESPRRARRLDLPGVLLGTVALASLTAAIIEFASAVWLSAALLVVALLSGILFALVERRQIEPMIPAGLFRSHGFNWAVGTGFLFNFALYGSLFGVALTFQTKYQLGPLGSGLAVLPLALLVSFGATASGFITAKLGARVPMLLGFSAAAVGATVIAIGDGVSSVSLIMVGLGLLGLCSFAMPAMTSVALFWAPAEHRGLASGVLNTSRQTGGAIGIAFLGAVLGIAGFGGLVLAMVIVVICYAMAVLSTLQATQSEARADS